MMNKKPAAKKAAAKPMKPAKPAKPAKTPMKPMGYAKGGMVKGKC